MIRIAIQTKGRLNQECIDLLRESGILIDENKRKFLTPAMNFPIEVLYLRDDDIPLAVANGVADLGIVGHNEVEENGFDVNIEQKLGFGACRLSLAVPKSDEYLSLDYFQGKRIATSYPNILERFLKANCIDAHITRIAGSVEIAPAAGMADAIFDIVSSGGTLISNGLREVEKVFYSEAVLISNPRLDEDKRKIVDELTFRIGAVNDSREMKYLLMNIPASSIHEAIKIIPAMRSPTVMPLAADGWCSLHSVVKADVLWDKVRQLQQIGAEGILVLSVDKIIK